MNRKLLCSVSVAAALAFSAPAALAQGMDYDAYASFFGGGNFVMDTSTTTSGLGYDDGGLLLLNSGFVGGAALGVHFAPNVRGEVELAFRGNGVSSYVEGGHSGNLAETGDYLSALTVMANIWYELPIDGSTSAHFGGGVGGAMLQLQLDEIDGLGGSPIDSSAFVAAAQVGVGISHQLDNGSVLSLDYRLLATTQATFTGSGSGSVDLSYMSQSVIAGIRFPIGN